MSKLPEKFWGGPGGRVMRSFNAHISYLEECAKLWEGKPHNAPDQAANVRTQIADLKRRRKEERSG